MGETATAAGLEEGEHSRYDRNLPRVIAVDGSAASGKSTVGRELAARLGYPFLDTGIMYRAITYEALERGVNLSDRRSLSRLASTVQMLVRLPDAGSGDNAAVTIDGKDVTSGLRRPDVEDAVSLVSRVAGVRDAMVRLQREIAARRAIVMAGRDIGTVVLPEADLKVYLDAPIEERAARRHREFERVGRDVTEEAVLDDIRRRDRIDSQRTLSPLKPAPDAVLIDTDDLTLDQVVAGVLALVEARR